MQNTSLISADFIADISEHVIIAVDYDGKILYFNRKAACIFTDIAEGGLLSSYLSDEDKIIIKYHIDIAFYQQRNLDFYWSYKKRFYLVGAHIFQQVLWLVFKDISELRQLTHRLSFITYQNTQVETLNNMGYWQLNIKQKQFYWSDGMYRLLGIKKTAVPYYGSILRQCMVADDFNFYKQKLKSILLNQNKEFSGHLRIMMPDKQIKHCYITAHRDYFNGMDVITGVLQANNEVFCCNGGVSTGYAQIAHDIKHHLQALSIFRVSDGHQEKSQTVIKYHIDKVTSLLDDMILLSQAQNCPSKIEFKQINLASLLSELCAEYQQAEYNYQIQIICRLNDVYIKTNAHILSRIVGNLLANALKFAKSKIILGNDKHHIWVADDGVGIPIEKQKEIFESFAQTDNQILRGSKGAGLGLHIVKELGQTLNIKLNLKSKPRCYSIFKLHFD